MSSDGRYLYHHPSNIPSSYDYSSYPPPPQQIPPTSYDNAQMAQAPPSQRQVRSHPAPQPHSPPQPTHYTNPPPQPPYPPTYAPPPYMTQPQWTGENWSYSQTYQAPPPPPPEATYSSSTSRTEPTASSSEQRSYPPPPPNPNPPRRMEERPPPPPNHTAQPPQQKPRVRERDSPPVVNQPAIPSGPDFIKLLESYRTIIDASEQLNNPTVSAPGRPLPTDILERMLQSATYGVQLLESATSLQPVPSLDTRPTVEKESEESREPANGAVPPSKRQKTDETVQEGQTCLGCQATSTPEWRRGPMGPRTLCNACGLVYAKLIKKRVRESNRALGRTNGQNGKGSHGPGDDPGAGSNGEGDSDDDSYGSQDHRSDGGNGRD